MVGMAPLLRILDAPWMRGLGAVGTGTLAGSTQRRPLCLDPRPPHPSGFPGLLRPGAPLRPPRPECSTPLGGFLSLQVTPGRSGRQARASSMARVVKRQLGRSICPPKRNHKPWCPHRLEAGQTSPHRRPLQKASPSLRRMDLSTEIQSSPPRQEGHCSVSSSPTDPSGPAPDLRGLRHMVEVTPVWIKHSSERKHSVNYECKTVPN